MKWELSWVNFFIYIHLLILKTPKIPWAIFAQLFLGSSGISFHISRAASSDFSTGFLGNNSWTHAEIPLEIPLEICHQFSQKYLKGFFSGISPEFTPGNSSALHGYYLQQFPKGLLLKFSQGISSSYFFQRFF